MNGCVGVVQDLKPMARSICSGSNPMSTCSPTTSVGVERLWSFTSSRMYAVFPWTLRSSKVAPLSERCALIQAQGGHPGCEYRMIFLSVVMRY